MASFSGYPQSVNFQTVNVSAGGGSENLLINPRGKINQSGEASGVLSAGAYFCDGWKAGAAGAEVYIDADGFRLINGSILQLVPNNLEAGRTIRGNMDVISGAPVISINGGSDNVLSDIAEYIQFEISGDNSKFTRLILAESVSLPIYQQQIDELKPCLRFYQQITIPRFRDTCHDHSGLYKGVRFTEMNSTPAATLYGQEGSAISLILGRVVTDCISIGYIAGTGGTFDTSVNAKLDARI